MASTTPPDPFYIEPECCLLCGVPEGIAPELFHTGEHHCAFIRQPRTMGEVDKTVQAMASSEVDCIRYRGDDDVILMRLGEAGLAALVDDAKAAPYSELQRDRVIFRPSEAAYQRAGAKDLASAFRRHLRNMPGIGTPRRHKIVPAFLRSRTVTFSWYGWNFHSVTFETPLSNGLQRASLKPAFPGALKGLARVVDDWLRTGPQCQEIEWLSSAQLDAGTKGYHSPY